MGCRLRVRLKKGVPWSACSSCEGPLYLYFIMVYVIELNTPLVLLRMRMMCGYIIWYC